MKYLKLIDAGIDIDGNQVVPISGKPIILGRERSCTVVYSENYTQVSRRHASVKKEKADIFLENLSSTNCCYVNSKAIKLTMRLTVNDIISLSPNGPSLQLVSKPPKATSPSLGKYLIISGIFNLALIIIYIYLCIRVNQI